MPTAPVSRRMPSQPSSRIGTVGLGLSDDRLAGDPRARSLLRGQGWAKTPCRGQAQGCETSGAHPCAFRNGDQPGLGEERLLDRTQSAREREMDNHQRRDDRRPEPLDRDRAQQCVDDQDRAQHEDRRARPGCEAAKQDQARGNPPAPAENPGAVDPERDQHGHECAERDRVLR